MTRTRGISIKQSFCYPLFQPQELNYAAICRAIVESSYDLYLGHEFSPKGDRIEALQRAFTTCDQ